MWPDQKSEECPAGCLQVHVSDQGRRRPAVPAAAKMGGDVTHVDGVGRGAGHQLQVLPQVHQEEQTSRLVQVADLVGQGRDLLDIPGCLGRGDHHCVPGKAERLDAIQQSVVEGQLLVSQRMVEEIADDCQVSPLLHQPGGATQVADRGRGVEQRAGILIDAQSQQGGLHRREGQASGDNPLQQQGHGRPHLLATVAPVGRQVAAQGVVVNDLHHRLVGHTLGGDQRLGVHQSDAFDVRAARQVLVAHVGQFIPVEGQKVAQIAIGAAGQHRPGLGVELPDGQLRGQAVEIGVFVSQYQVRAHPPPRVA